MNGTIKKAISNFKFVISAQLIVLAFGFLKSLLVPSFLSVGDFGYWQIYLFYSSYVGVFALGFNDGIYLRYGDYEYEELPYKKLRTAIRIHVFVLVIFSAVTFIYAGFEDDINRKLAFWFISASILVLGINGVFIYILQITNQMKRYSFYSILDKVIVMVAIVVFAFAKIMRFEYLVIIDLLSKIVVVIGMIVFCKELWVGENCNCKEAFDEYQIDVSVGIKLMLAQLMGMLVTGIGRFIVEWLGDIEKYAYYSFGVTITNLVLVLITAISLLVYPTLKRLDADNYPRYYEKINNLLQKFNILVPLFYFVAAILIPILLPKYNSVLIYLNILFAVIILQAKMQLLNNTFYKALRKETAMMIANLSSVVFFAIFAAILFSLTKSIWSIALCTLIIMGLLCIASEIYLRKVMHLRNFKGIIFETLFIISFVVITSTLSLHSSFILYGCFLLITSYKFRHKIIGFVKNFRS